MLFLLVLCCYCCGGLFAATQQVKAIRFFDSRRDGTQALCGLGRRQGLKRLSGWSSLLSLELALPEERVALLPNAGVGIHHQCFLRLSRQVWILKRLIALF